MRTPLVMANWKMNGNFSLAESLLTKIGVAVMSWPLEVAIAPPFVYLPQARTIMNSTLSLGAQNLSEHEAGAFTGEISAAMLKECGCQYAIVGHSERRAFYGDTGEVVLAKTKQALLHGLTPVVCVGESKQEYEAGQTEQVVAGQLDVVINALDQAALAKLGIAYEPVWAIGTGLAATPEIAQSVHSFLRGCVAKCSKEVAKSIRILYGGSVKPGNAAGLFTKEDIDGGLIGGASLDAEAFIKICSEAK